MPIPLCADLPHEDLRAGWRKIANRYGPVHVFRLADGRLLAVTNKAQGGGLGTFVETIAPAADADVAPAVETETHGLGAYAGRTSHEGSGS